MKTQKGEERLEGEGKKQETPLDEVPSGHGSTQGLQSPVRESLCSLPGLGSLGSQHSSGHKPHSSEEFFSLLPRTRSLGLFHSVALPP